MTKLEKAANIVAIGTCVIAIAALVENRCLRESKTKAGAGRQGVELQLVGKSLRLENLSWDQSKRNVVLVIKHSCPYCSMSMPFYRKLSALRREYLDLGLIVISPDPLQETSRIMEDEGIAPSKTLEMKLAAIGVFHTPTILVVDEKGIVQKALVGKLDERGEQELIDALIRPR